MKKIICIMILFANFYATAQVGTAPAPLKPGNRWVYNEYLAGDYSKPYPLQFEITDSIKVINGIPFYVTRGGGYYGITSDQFYARYDIVMVDSLYRYFKTSITKGDSWEQRWYFVASQILYSTVSDTFSAQVFGKNTLIYVIDRTDSVIVGSREYWTKEYGMLDGLYEQEEDILKGCLIDGVLYGDTTVTGIEEVKELPDKFVLYQNYPNPFNPSTNIKYYLPESGTVKLVIYNVLGEEVKTLVNAFQNRNSYNINVNLLNLSSGVYIYSLNFTGERGKHFSSVKKMILLK